MTVQQTLKSAAAKLNSGRLNQPHLEAEILLAAILKKPRVFLLAHGEKKLTAGQISLFRRQISRRLKGEPVAYLIGRKEFYGLNFKVNKNVLIPRPETELMVEEALKLSTNGAKRLTLVDVGTGSGCVIIALAKLLNQKSGSVKRKFIGIDISKKALTVAGQNAKLHGAAKNIKFIKGDLLKPIIQNSKLKLSNSKLIIAANLPYLTPAQIKKSPSIKYEPESALDGGAGGLDLYRKLAKQIKNFRGIRIILLCEIDPGQARAMKKIFSSAKDIRIKKDLCGHDRLAIIKL